MGKLMAKMHYLQMRMGQVTTYCRYGHDPRLATTADPDEVTCEKCHTQIIRFGERRSNWWPRAMVVAAKAEVERCRKRYLRTYA